MGRRTMIRAGRELVIPTVAAGRYSASGVPAGSIDPGRSGEALSYRVRRGDTLSGIARRHGTTAAATAAASGISIHKLLQIGERLSVTRSAAVAHASGRTTHVVRRGDSLWRIASIYRTTVDELCGLNRISRHSTLYPGTKLVVRVP